MITVNELRSRREDGTAKFIESISSTIEANDKRGCRRCGVDIPKNVNIDTVISELSAAGFGFRRSQGDDDRGDSWDVLYINWT